MCKFLKENCIYKHFMRVLITNGYIVYYFNVVAFKTEIYDMIWYDMSAIERFHFTNKVILVIVSN